MQWSTRMLNICMYVDVIARLKIPNYCKSIGNCSLIIHKLVGIHIFHDNGSV